MKVMYANLVLEENTCTMMLVRHFRVVVVSINSGYYIFYSFIYTFMPFSEAFLSDVLCSYIPVIGILDISINITPCDFVIHHGY